MLFYAFVKNIQIYKYAEWMARLADYTYIDNIL